MEQPMSDKQTRKTRLYDRNQLIKLLNTENPRRKGSNRSLIFEAIRDGMTVDAFLKASSQWNGGTKDLQILVNSGHIKVLPAANEFKPPVTPKEKLVIVA
jgi:hypothetical protein